MGKKHASQYANFGWLPFESWTDAVEMWKYAGICASKSYNT